jgi:hypothetical protein
MRGDASEQQPGLRRLVSGLFALAASELGRAGFRPDAGEHFGGGDNRIGMDGDGIL